MAARRKDRWLTRGASLVEIKWVVLLRDGLRCTRCGMTNDEHRRLCRRNLDVHRVTPRSLYLVRLCVTLCRTCHSITHGGSGKRMPPHVTVVGAPEWVERVQAAADKLGLSASAYLRMVTTQRMDQDGVPKPHGRKRKSDTD